MDPIPGTAQALAEAGRYLDRSLVEEFREQGRLVQELVRSCWGMSLTFSRERMTFTMVGSHPDVGGLDAVQLLVGGPCLDALDEDRDVSVPDLQDATDEDRWRLFASTSAAAGVRSSMSFPLRQGGDVIGGLNLYASEPHAFDDHVGELAAVLRVCGEEAVANADLGFTTRDQARQAPEHARESALVDQAVGVVVGRRHVPVEQARAELVSAAEQAGVDLADLADLVVRGVDRHS